MAPVGHTLEQPPQPAHRWVSIVTRSPSLLIAPVEQTSMQRLHPGWLLRLWAQMRSL